MQLGVSELEVWVTHHVLGGVAVADDGNDGMGCSFEVSVRPVAMKDATDGLFDVPKGRKDGENSTCQPLCDSHCGKGWLGETYR